MEQQVRDQFREITHFDEETEGEKVERLLTVCNWNLEIALARYFDNDFPQLFDDVHSSAEPVERTESDRANNFDPTGTTSHPLDDGIIGNIGAVPLTPDQILFTDTILPKLQRAMPISNKWKFQLGLLKNGSNADNKVSKNRFLTSIIFLLMLVPRFVFLTGYFLNKVLSNFAPSLFRILGFGDDDDPDEVFPAAPLYNSIEEVSSYKIDKYILERSEIGKDEKDEPLELPIFKGEFNEAYEEARSNLKWMCVILFNSKSPSTDKLINNMLVNPVFIDFIKKNDIVLYVGDVCYPEPFEVAKTYNAYQLPYFSLIANVSLTGLTAPEFSVVSKYTKLAIHLKTDKSIVKICKKIDRIVSKYEPQLVSQRYDKQEMDMARLIREQQDQAYQESLLRDKQNQEMKEKLRLQKELEEAKLIEEQRRLEEIKYKNSEILIHYINNNYQKDLTNLAKGEFTVIQFRTQNGNRFIRKFSKDETLLDIFMYVASKQLIDKILIEKDYECIKTGDPIAIDLSSLQSEEDVIEYFSLYKFKFIDIEKYDKIKKSLKLNFDLVSPMPRLKLEPSLIELNKVKELWPNGSLLIEMNQEEEEDEDEDYEDEE